MQKGKSDVDAVREGDRGGHDVHWQAHAPQGQDSPPLRQADSHDGHRARPVHLCRAHRPGEDQRGLGRQWIHHRRHFSSPLRRTWPSATRPTALRGSRWRRAMKTWIRTGRRSRRPRRARAGLRPSGSRQSSTTALPRRPTATTLTAHPTCARTGSAAYTTLQLHVLLLPALYTATPMRALANELDALATLCWNPLGFAKDGKVASTNRRRQVVPKHERVQSSWANLTACCRHFRLGARRSPGHGRGGRNL